MRTRDLQLAMPSLACDCDPGPRRASMRYSHQTDNTWQACAPVITKYPTNCPEPPRLTWPAALFCYFITQCQDITSPVHFRPIFGG